jgi:hypothetical protein
MVFLYMGSKGSYKVIVYDTSDSLTPVSYKIVRISSMIFLVAQPQEQESSQFYTPLVKYW